MRDNPYRSFELRIPAEFHDEVNAYARTQSDPMTRTKIDMSPFKRYVDMWFLAFILGIQRGRRTKVHNPHKFIEAEILSRDPERLDLVELIAIWDAGGDETILARPRDVIDMANEYAATGLPELVGMLRDGQDAPIWNLTDSVTALLQTSTTANHPVA